MASPDSLRAPPRYVDQRMAFPEGVRLVTNASPPGGGVPLPPKTLWYALRVGKLEEAVLPVTYRLPVESNATSSPSSEAVPPRYAPHSSVPLVEYFAT